MVELVSSFPSSRLGGDAYHESGRGELCGPLQSRGAFAYGHGQGVGGVVERRDVNQLTRLGDYSGGAFIVHGSREIAAQDPCFDPSTVSEKHLHRHPAGPEAMEHRGSPAGSSWLGEKSPGAAGSASQRAHIARLQMVGAVDKTDTRGGPVDRQDLSALLDPSGDSQRDRTQWNLPSSPFASSFSKRSVTVGEVNLIQAIGQGVICTDLDGNITLWNRTAEAMYLWKAEEVMSQNVVELLAHWNYKKDLMEVMGRVSRGEAWSGQHPAVRKDGVIIDTVVSNTPVVDDNKNIVGIVGVSFDAGPVPFVNDAPRRTYSDEGLSNDTEKECAPGTGSVDGENIRSSRRFHVDDESRLAERLPDAKSSATAGSGFLRIGLSAVQQLLRKVQIGSGLPQEDIPLEKTAGQSKPGEDFGQYRNLSSSGCSVEQPQMYPAYIPFESRGADPGEGDRSFLPPMRLSGREEPTLWEPLGPQKDALMEVVGNSMVVPRIVTFNQSLSRSSSGSPPGSATGPDASVVGKSSDRSPLDSESNIPQAGLNFQQAQEDFQLQLALALRVAAEAAAVDDPHLSSNVRGPKGNVKLMPGCTKTEATAYRYWVSSCLSYDDRIEDGFYEVWGMSPYVWSMCTDTSELGRMPPLESLRAVPPNDATMEVVFVDRNTDSPLRDIEDKAVGLAYESTDVLDMASELSIIVADFMGGPASSDDELLEGWQATCNELTQILGTIVLPIGRLGVGLSRHRALLFKVMADSVGLPCRIVGSSGLFGKEDDAAVIVKSEDNKEWVVDLLVKPGSRFPPDKRLAARPTVIPALLQFERASQFTGGSVSVLHWTRDEPRGKDGGSRKEGSARRNAADSKSNFTSPRQQMADKTPSALKGLNFVQSEGPKATNIKVKGFSEDRLKGDYDMVDLVNRPESRTAPDPQLRSPDAGKANFFMEDVFKPQNVGDRQPRVGSGQDSRHSDTSEDGGRGQERGWAREGRRPTGSDESGKFGGGGKMKLMSVQNDFEIAWEDIVLGERIGQGSFGKVYRADWQGSDVAVKVFLDQDLMTEALEEYKSEVAIMRRLRHPNIVLYMGAVTKPPNLSLITEFCPRGSLYRLLHRPNRELDDRKRIRMAMDVAKGMNYLHRCTPPVVHRDLKSPNLLVDKNWTVKVCDFGLSRQKHNTFLSSKSGAGTPEWMAPEVLRNEPSDEKSDVYSFGVILWELATLQVPWSGMNPIQVVGAVGFQHRRLPIPDDVDPAISAMIQACWRTDSKLRPSFADIMQELKILQQRPVTGQASQNSPSVQQTRAQKNTDED